MGHTRRVRSRRHSGEAGAAFVAADQYGVAAKLARALPADVRMVSVDGRWAQTDLPRTAIAGQIGILVNNARMAGARSGGPWSTLTEIGQAARQRGGATIEQFWIYRVTGAGRRQGCCRTAPTLSYRGRSAAISRKGGRRRSCCHSGFSASTAASASGSSSRTRVSPASSSPFT